MASSHVRQVRSSGSYKGEENLWENLGLVERPVVEEGTSDGVVVRIDEDERYVFAQPELTVRDRLRIARGGSLPELHVTHHYTQFFDPTSSEVVTRDKAERQWVMAESRDFSGRVDPSPKEQSLQVMEMMKNRPAAVSPTTIQMLKDLRKREGQITIRLPAGVHLTRDQRREVSAFVRRLAKGYENAGEVLVPKPA